MSVSSAAGKLCDAVGVTGANKMMVKIGAGGGPMGSYNKMVVKEGDKAMKNINELGKKLSQYENQFNKPSAADKERRKTARNSTRGNGK